MHTSGQQSPNRDGITTLNWSHGATGPAVEVIRLLDPEPREPFVSLAGIFAATGLTPIQGLLKFPELKRPAFDLSLGGVAPFVDLWVPLRTARNIAEQLGVINELAGLLEWETRRAYSVHDREEGGLVHNWRIASDRIDPSEYSTTAMLSVTFPRLHILPHSAQVRTLMPDSPSRSSSSSPREVCPSTFASLLSHLVDWSVLEYEAYLDSAVTDGEAAASRQESTNENDDLAPSLLFTTMLSYLRLINEPGTSASDGYAYEIVPGFKVDRRQVHRFALGGTDQARPRLAFIDTLSRIVMREWRNQEAQIVIRGRSGLDALPLTVERRDEMADRLSRLERTIDDTHVEDGRRADQIETSMLALVDRLDALEARIASTSKRPRAVAHRDKTDPQNQVGRQGSYMALHLLLGSILAVLAGILGLQWLAVK